MAQVSQPDGSVAHVNALPHAGERTFRFRGLTSAEVEASRQRYGANVLTPPERDPWWKLWLAKFDDPVIRILMIAAVVALGVGIIDGAYVEGLGIIIAILLATTLAFWNEYKANKAFDILNQVSDEVAIQVIRAGNYTTVPRKDLVVGDIVRIEMGGEVPADGDVLETVSLQVDQARLTGEALPVTKVAKGAVDQQAAQDTAYSADTVRRGTIVTNGHGITEVTAVGDATEIGRAAREATEETGVQTPLNRQLERLSKAIGVAAFLIAGCIYVALGARGVLVSELTLTAQQWCFAGLLMVSVLLALSRVWLPIVYDAFKLLGREVEPPSWLEQENLSGWLKTAGLGVGVFAAGLGTAYGLEFIPSSPGNWLPSSVGEEFLKYFMIAVTIIVVAVPEGLAMSVTLSLAYSMKKMTATNNLVRRMHACETLGAATVICSDKTGTLTLNEMRVEEVNFPALQSLRHELPSFAERLIVEAMAANTTAQLDRTPGAPPRPLGNPTEGALLLWLEEHGIDYHHHRTQFLLTSQWPFSTEKKFMGTLGSSPVTGGTVLHVKGAPEIVLDQCSHVLTDQGAKPLDGYKATIEQALRSHQARAMRTLAFAYREAPKHHEGVDLEQIAVDTTWLGFAAITDPVRPDVPAAIQACRDAGIVVKIVTGDNPETAQEIARQIGLWDEQDTRDQHLAGREFALWSHDEAKSAAATLKILSRARPAEKRRLVQLLQEQGHVVAVTGDGVNDGPALNYANVGLAMGKTGTAVAKEASDIILLDDSFRSIVNGVMWGRSLYQNIQRFILFQLTINVAACGIALLGPFIGIKFPLTVIQMLWVNLIMDTLAALALATEPPDESVMQRPPRDSQAFIVSGPMARHIFTVAPIFLGVLVGLLLFMQRDGVVTDYELSIFFTVFVLLQFWNLFNARCLGLQQSAFANIGKNKWFLTIATAIFLGQILMVQFGGTMFRTVPLSWRDWVLIIAGTSVVLWIGELWRLVMRVQSQRNRL